MTLNKPSDFEVDNASGSAVRQDINEIFGALRSNNALYAGAPTTKYKYMWYADSGTDKMSFYKANATDKLDFISLTDGSFFGPNGSVSNPSYTFSNSTSTGFFRAASNEVGVSCNSFNIAKFTANDFNVFGDLKLAHPAGGNTEVQISAEGTGDVAVLDLAADSTYSDYGLRLRRLDGANGVSEIKHRGTGSFEIISAEVSDIKFKTDDTARWAIQSGGGIAWQGYTNTMPTLANGNILANGFISKAGATAGALVANPWNLYWNGAALQAYVDSTHIGNVSVTSSDYRIKQNITTQTESGIDKIKQLRPVSYQFKDHLVFKADGVTREGFIAHEVQEVIPSAVEGEKDGESIQSLNTDAIVSVLTKALQEAVAKIETLETKVAALEAK